MKSLLNILSRLTMLVLAMGVVEAKAQEPSFSARFSKDTVEVGDQVEYIIDVVADRVAPIEMPVFGDVLSDSEKKTLQRKKQNISTYTDYNDNNLELVKDYDIDTIKVDGKMLHLRKRYRFVVMETGNLMLRPAILYLQKNRVEYDTLYANRPIHLYARPYKELDTLNFMTNNTFAAPGMAPIQGPVVDTTLVRNHLNTSGIMEQRDMPFIIEELRGDDADNTIYYVVALLALVAICVVVYIVVRRHRRGGEVEKPLLPPHVEANKALVELHHRKLWQNDKHNLYYTLLTNILRRYISRRWDIRAMEFTTEEIVEASRTLDMPRESRSNLITILRTADMAKFAKAKPDDELNEECYTMAYYFVENTKPIEVDGVEGKEDITIDTKIGD